MLAYLFTCCLKDGTCIQQTQADVSASDSTRSAFYDVLQRIDEVETFRLTDGSHTYLVDLRDGHFEVDGVRFNAQSDELPGTAEYRLIYFHRHCHQVVGGQMQGDLIEYYIGWQATIDGKNYKQMISVC
jgi:hypothetical protein